MPQMQLPIFPHGSTEINLHLAFCREEDQVTYLYGHLPIFTHHVKDIPSFRLIISQIYINGSAKQSEICRAFGVTSATVKRSVKLYREKGSAGFYKKRNGRGTAVLTAPVLEQAQHLFDEGIDISEAAEKLDIKKDTLRKAVDSGRLHAVKKKCSYETPCITIQHQK